MSLLLRVIIGCVAVLLARVLVPFLGWPGPFQQVTVVLLIIGAMLYVFEGHGPKLRV